jgi:hypothetical protein
MVKFSVNDRFDRNRFVGNYGIVGAMVQRRKGSLRPVACLRISTRFGAVSFLNTVTVFGTPNDVTLAELALEMLFPADEQTVDIVNQMDKERSALTSLGPRSLSGKLMDVLSPSLRNLWLRLSMHRESDCHS